MGLTANIFIAKTAGQGVLVSQNSTLLNGAIDDAVTTVVIDDNLYSDGNTITVDGEDILIGTAGLSNTGCTRAQNGTSAAAHSDNTLVRLKAGTTILTYTSTSAETFTAIYASGSVEAWYGIEITDSGGSAVLGYVMKSSPYQLECFYMMTGITPTSGDVIKIVVYNWYDEGLFHAVISR